jgi:hypothetical protein
MLRSHSLLAWLATILTLIAYITGALFMSQGFMPVVYMSEQVFNRVIQVFAIDSVLACLAALFAMSREQTTAYTGILRLPKSKPAKRGLGFTAAFYPAVFLFTGNTLFDFIMAFHLPDEKFMAILRPVETLGLWTIVGCAVGAVVMALVALIKHKDRGLVLGLPLLPVIMVFGFILGEILGHG